MNQLFTVYAQQSPSAATAVATANGTLDWHYVAGGLPGTSGASARSPRACTMSNSTAHGGGVETCLPGDANLDGTVDINDLTIVLAHYNQTGMSWTQGEFTGDGTVDINDLTIVLANYNQSVGAAPLAAVPEPSSVALLAAVALSAVWVIGRRTSGGVSQVLKAVKASMPAPPRFRGGAPTAPTPRAARCFFVRC